MVFFIGFVYIAFFSLLIFKIKFFLFERIRKRWILLLYFIKLSAAFLWLHTYSNDYNREQGDLNNYIHDSAILYDLSKKDKYAFFNIMIGNAEDKTEKKTMVYSKAWFSNTDAFNKTIGIDSSSNPPRAQRFITRLNVLFRFLSFNHFQVHFIFFASISFLGIILWVKALAILGINPLISLIALGITPSILFWSGGISKEAIMVFSIGLSLFSILKTGKKTHYLLLAVFGIWLMSTLKPYILICFSIPLILLMFIKKTNFEKKLIYCLFPIILIITFMANSHYGIGPSIVDALINKMNAQIYLCYKFNAGSFLTVPKMSSDFTTLIEFIPYAIKNTLIHPYWEDISNIKALPFVFENLILWILLFVFIYKAPKTPIDKDLCVYLILSYLILILIIGFSIPVLGTIIRLESLFLPYMFILFLLPFQKIKKT